MKAALERSHSIEMFVELIVDSQKNRSEEITLAVFAKESRGSNAGSGSFSLDDMLRRVGEHVDGIVKAVTGKSFVKVSFIFFKLFEEFFLGS